MSTEEDIDLGTYNFEGVTPFAGSGPAIPHRIPVRAKIVDFSAKPKEGDLIPDGQGGSMLALNVMLTTEVTEPAEYVGARRTFFLRCAPTDDSEDGKKDWKRIVTTLVSGGYQEADVAQNGIPLKKSTFMGLEPLHVRNEHILKDGKKGYDQISVITPEVYKEEQDHIAKHGQPDQTPIIVTTAKGKAAAAAAASNGGGDTNGASAGKGGVASGGGGLTKGPAKGGGAKGLRNSLTKSAGA